MIVRRPTGGTTAAGFLASPDLQALEHSHTTMSLNNGPDMITAKLSRQRIAAFSTAC